MPSICLVSRLMTLDLPWYAEWLEYHDALGIDRFHLYYCDDTYRTLREVLSFVPSQKVTLTRVPKRLAEADLVALAARSCREEFLLAIDSDEFLVLPGGAAIGDFLDAHAGYDLFHFPWVMCPWTGEPFASLFAQAASVPSYRVTQHKSMAHTRLVAGCGDQHDFALSGAPRSTFRTEQASVQHFALRGVGDAYLRCRDQSLRNHRGDAAKLALLMEPGRDAIRVGEIPRRLLAALGEVQCGNARSLVPLPRATISVTDRSLLDPMLTREEREIFDRRWEDLTAAGLFDGFSIRDFPKLEIWRHLEGRTAEVVPLRRLGG